MYVMAITGAIHARVVDMAVRPLFMRVTTFTDYALRVLMYLALQEDRRATVDEIASAYGISANHLTKVVHLLGKAGWAQTVRGKGGGLQLGVSADSIRLGAVVRLCEGNAAFVDCMVKDLKHQCRIAPACRLTGILDGAFRVFYAELDRHSLADLVQEPQALQDLLAPNPA